MDILPVLIIGAGVAFVLQGLKIAGLRVPHSRKILRSLVALAALVIAYLALREQADVTVTVVLTYAAGIIASAEVVYRWLIKQIVPE